MRYGDETVENTRGYKVEDRAVWVYRTGVVTGEGQAIKQALDNYSLTRTPNISTVDITQEKARKRSCPKGWDLVMRLKKR
jgi:hypothetical protein